MPIIQRPTQYGGMGRQNMNNEGDWKNDGDCIDGIKDVWKDNLDEEFVQIRKIIKDYPYIAMDTEFPGVVAKPEGQYNNMFDYQYQTLRCNVDLLKIIQIGFSFFNEQGHAAPGVSTWQFNFQFDLQVDTYAEDSIQLLQKSGLHFQRHQRDGIDPKHFSVLLITSGAVMVDNVKFLSFHSGYDFGYLMRMLTASAMPESEAVFFERLSQHFPVIYDVKFLMKSCKNLKGGLQEVSEQLKLERVGPQHQAGSDSLLTGHTFFQMRELYFEGHIDNDKYLGHLYGLGATYVNGTGEAPPPPPPPQPPGQGPTVASYIPACMATDTTTNGGEVGEGEAEGEEAAE